MLPDAVVAAAATLADESASIACRTGGHNLAQPGNKRTIASETDTIAARPIDPPPQLRKQETDLRPAERLLQDGA
jgi:hypothetical protein